MRAFFFGAGSSYGTLGDLAPLSKNFGAVLAKQTGFEGRYPNLSQAALHIGKRLSEIGLEELWTCVDYYAKLSGNDADCALGSKPYWLDGAVAELKTDALLWMYGRRCDEKAKTIELSDEYTLVRILNEVNDGHIVVSFNYDTLVERLLIRLDKHPHHDPPCPKDYARLLKPHGSTSWPTDVSLTTLRTSPLLDPLAARFNNDPLVLGAVPIKSELIREVQFCRSWNVFEVVMHQWKGVVDGVRDADELVVVGYSFPHEDGYGHFLFKEALQKRTKRLKKIEVYNVTADLGSIAGLFREKTDEIHWKGPIRRP